MSEWPDRLKESMHKEAELAAAVAGAGRYRSMSPLADSCYEKQAFPVRVKGIVEIMREPFYPTEDSCKMKSALKVSALVLTAALATGCATTDQAAMDAASAAQAAADAAASAAESARAAADRAAQAAAGAQRTADQALSAANEAQNCCDANRESMERMFQKSMSK